MRNDSDLAGTLLAATSAHDPDPTLQVRVIRFLIRSGADINETDKNGVTPLHRAVRFRSTEAVKELIVQGADVNAVEKRTESTPLHRVVTNTGAPATAGNSDDALGILKLLLSNGADTRIKNRKGKMPVEYARKQEMKEILSRQDAR